MNVQTPAALPCPGDTIGGKYAIEGLLGAGGAGAVYSATDVELGRRVAIKFLLPELALDAEARARFLREGRATALLSSEHVVEILEVGGEPEAIPYLVMELLEGLDLGGVLERDGPLPVTTAVDCVVQACDALADAHARGIVHRDLKPQNLFLVGDVTGAGQRAGVWVKLVDFGMCTAWSGDGPQGSLTSSQITLGSPLYMSPEQTRNPRTVDPRTDVWSLGVILHELLTGRPPFQASTFGGLCAAILTEHPPPANEQRADVPEGLAEAVTACLSKDVTRRLASVTELAQLLAPYASPACAALVARRQGRASGPAPAPEQARTRVASTVALVVMAVVVGFVALGLATRLR